MKLGEIKLQALMLIFPLDVLEYNEENIEEVVYNLRGSSNYSSYISASVGAINRAFSTIEQRGLSGKDSLRLELKNGTRQGEYIVFDLSEYTEILKISEIYLNGVCLAFDMKTRATLQVKGPYTQGTLEIIYYKRLKRINHATSNILEIELGGIEEAIPYFVKADLLLGERAEEAEAARKIYENILNEYTDENGDRGVFHTVYSLGRL